MESEFEERLDQFKGKLAERFRNPLQPRASALVKVLGDQKRQEKLEVLEKKRRTEEVEKLFLLIDHYNIDRNSPSSFVFLSIALAQDFVEGFQEEKPKIKPGRRSKWTFQHISRLYSQVNKLTGGEANLTIVGACDKLAQTKEWASFLDKQEATGTDPAAALRHAYYQFGKKLKEIESQTKDFLS